MNLESLYFPFDLAEELNALVLIEKVTNEANGEVHFLIPEELLVRIMLKAGAILPSRKGEMNSEGVKNELAESLLAKSVDNELVVGLLDEALLEVSAQNAGNSIRSIMVWKNLSLKEMGLRYGGKSGASNLANFLSKSDIELQVVKRTTLLRIAEALDFPIEQLEQLIQHRIDQNT